MRAPRRTIVLTVVVSVIIAWAGTTGTGDARPVRPPGDTKAPVIARSAAGGPGWYDAALSFRAQIDPGFQFELDTGFQPPISPLKERVFFYLSDSEVDVSVRGKLNATWNASQADPGQTITINLQESGQSIRWESDGGIRGGYMYGVFYDIGPYHYQFTDYVPDTPNIDMSWPCDVTRSPANLVAQTSICAPTWGNGGALCVLELPLGTTMPGSCGGSATPDPPSLGWCFNPMSNYTPADSARGFCVKFYPYPEVELQICADNGLCWDTDFRGNAVVDSTNGKRITSSTPSMNFNVTIPCEFAQASSSKRVYTFTREPFGLDADMLVGLIGKLVPKVQVCLAEALLVGFNIPLAVCGKVIPSAVIAQLSRKLPFGGTPATFEVEVEDPAVESVKPSGSYAFVASPTRIKWTTSWDPDQCGCRVEVSYRTAPTISDLYLVPYTVIADTLSVVGGIDWVFTDACMWGQVFVEFRDPNGQYLADREGLPFRIVPGSITPGEVDFGDVVVAQSGNQYISIQNPDSVEVMPIRVDVPSIPEFRVEDPNDIGSHYINPGYTLDLLLGFVPDEEGPELGDIGIRFYCPQVVAGVAGVSVQAMDSVTVLVPLSGVGVTPTGLETPSIAPKSVFHVTSPNPFNPSATLKYEVGVSGRVTLTVFDVAGRRIRTLVDRHHPAGTQSVTWDGRNHLGRQLPSGVYFARLVVAGESHVRKMVLLK